MISFSVDFFLYLIIFKTQHKNIVKKIISNETVYLKKKTQYIVKCEKKPTLINKQVLQEKKHFTDKKTINYHSDYYN